MNQVQRTMGSYELVQRRRWSSPVTLMLLLLSLFFIGVAVHFSTLDPLTPSVTWGVALLLGGIAVAFYGDRNFDMFSPIFAFGISFAMQYGVALILPFTFAMQGPYGAWIRSILDYYPEAGMASFMALAGFYMGYSNGWIERNPSALMRWEPGAMGLKVLWTILFWSGAGAFVVLLISGVFFQVTKDIETPLFYSAVGFVQSGIFVAVPLAVGMAFSTKHVYWRNAGILSVSVLLFFGIPSGSKTLMLLAVVFVAMAWNYSKSRFTRAQAALALMLTVILIVIVSPFNAMYREAITTIEDRDRTITFALEEVRFTMNEFMATDPEALVDLAFDYAGSRLSNISVVATVIQYHAQGGPLHMGETYSRAVYGLIPRFLWMEKPSLSLGGEIVVELGYAPAEVQRLGKDVSLSSVGITFVGEQVYNFGWLLTFFVSLVFGVFYKWLYVSFRVGLEVSAVALGIYGFLWYTLVFTAHEANFAGILAGAVKVFIVLVVLFILLRFKKHSVKAA